MSKQKTTHPPIHIILEYNPSPEFQGDAAKTIEKHEEVLRLSPTGTVLWPKISRSGRTKLEKEHVPRINDLIEKHGVETHFYMYAPQHKGFDRRLDVGLLKKIYLGDQIEGNDLRIPRMYEDIKEQRMYYFELERIEPIKQESIDEVLENLLIYPEVTFLDLVSLVSPQTVLEVERQEFFPR
jgi:hypothetical protein